jgi:hypothetical protein
MMGCVMFSCPVTGNAISTGVETDDFSLRQARRFKARSRCPDCGGEHVWSESDVWICDAIPLQSPRAI